MTQFENNIPSNTVALHGLPIQKPTSDMFPHSVGETLHENLNKMNNTT